MPRFVEDEVRQRAKDPSPSGRLTLLIGYDGSGGAVENLVEDFGGEVHETLPFGTLTASVPETAIERLLDCPAVETVELDSGMTALERN